MRLVAKAADLAAAARIAASAADAKGRIPILGAVLIEASDTLAISGTNLDLALKAECACTIEAPGRAAVPAAALSGLLAGMAADLDVVVETLDAGVQIKAGRSRYRLEGLSADDFPQPPRTPASTELKLSRDQVRHLLSAVAFIIPSEDTRYYYCGAYLHRTDGRLTSVASDAPSPDTCHCRHRTGAGCLARARSDYPEGRHRAH